MGNVLAKPPAADVDRDALFRLFGIRTANEQDDNTMQLRQRFVRGTAKLAELAASQKDDNTRIEIQVDRVNKQVRINEYPNNDVVKAAVTPAKPAAPPTVNNTQKPSVEDEMVTVPTIPDAYKQIVDVGEQLNPFVHPGSVHDMHDHCKEMQPKSFDGCRMLIAKPMSNTLSIGHLLRLTNKSYYQFSASYTSEEVNEITGQPLTKLIGDIDARGNTTATVIHFFLPRLRTQLKANIVKSQMEFMMLHNDYLGSNYTCSLILNNIDLKERQGIAVASYLQQVLPSLALGVEFIYQCEEECPNGVASLITAVACYKKNNKQWTGAVNVHALELCYSHYYSESLSASLQFYANVLRRQAITRLCYQCTIPRGLFTFRGYVDTRGVVCAVCEKRLAPLPLTLALSGRVNHISKNFVFGIGLSLD